MTPGHLWIISGPSGSGKSTLIKKILQNNSWIHFPISVTTRQPREGEVEGLTYYFVTQKKFDELIEERAFLEYAEVYGNHYGTLNKVICDGLHAGEMLLKDIDTQGAQSLMDSVEQTNLTSIFILPPSDEELRKRLSYRQSESSDSFQERLASAKNEMKKSSIFEYSIINDDLEVAFQELASIIKKTKPSNTLSKKS